MYSENTDNSRQPWLYGSHNSVGIHGEYLIIAPDFLCRHTTFLHPSCNDDML